MYFKFVLMVLGRRQGRGFVVPMVLMIGLVMVVAGVVMLQKGQQDQNSSTNQKVTAQALSVAEAGVTRIQDLILGSYAPLFPDCQMALPSPTPSGWTSGMMGRNSSGVCQNDSGGTTSPVLSWANMTSTNDEVKNYLSVCGIPPSPGASPTANQALAANIKAVAQNNKTWQPINSADLNQGEYRVVSYEFTPDTPGTPAYLPNPPGTGVLVLEARVNQSGANNATARLEVSIPVLPNTTTPTIPGVWITEGDTGNNTIQGNVLINDCSITTSSITVSNPSVYTVAHTKQRFPELPSVTCNTFSNSSKNFTYAGNGTAFTPTNKLESPSGTITLPRTGGTPPDTAVSRTLNDGTTVNVYEYCVDEVAFNSGSNTITITPGQRVSFYLKGSINVGANSEIIHACGSTPGCKPADFQIFGYGIPSSPQPSICLTGNNYLDAFVIAPNYKVGVAGSGGGAGGIKGTVWAQEWSNGGGCGSNTSNIVVQQTDTWSELYTNLGSPEYRIPSLSAVSQWQRKQVQ